MNNYKNRFTKSGVTLLSLVITVIILIILAGVTINITIGEQGIFKHGQEAKVKQEIAEYLDNIELARGEVTIDKLGRVTLDDIIKKIEDNNIIPGGKIEKLDEEKAEVITKEGYVIIVTLKETKYDRLETQQRIPELQEGDIVISQPTWNASTNKASVEIRKGSNISQTLQIQYQVNGDSENGWTTGTSVGNLNHGDVVNARLWNGASGGSYTSLTVEDSTVPNVPTITFVSGTEGSNGYYISDVVLKITEGSDDQSGVQKVTYELSGATTKTETTITSGNNITISADGTTTVTAYTYDKANNKSEKATYTVEKDETAPGDASITISGSATQTVLPVTLKATVTHSEATSGITIASCKYVLSTESENIGTNPSSYTGGTFSSNGQEITIEPNSATQWYLHVLTIDGAGHAKETIKGPITVTENKHSHTGSASSGGECYTKPVYHTHDGDSTNGGVCYATPTYHSHTGNASVVGGCYGSKSVRCTGMLIAASDSTWGSTSWVTGVMCGMCGYKTSYSSGTVVKAGQKVAQCSQKTTTIQLTCGKSTSTIVGYSLSCTKSASTIDKYDLGCGKNEGDIESFTIIY